MSTKKIPKLQLTPELVPAIRYVAAVLFSHCPSCGKASMSDCEDQDGINYEVVCMSCEKAYKVRVEKTTYKLEDINDKK